MNHGQTPQPTVDDSKSNPANPVSRTSAETNKANQQQSSLNDPAVFTRRPGDQAGIEPNQPSMAAGSSHSDHAEESARPADQLDGEQMRPAAEGDVMRAQFNKTGTGEEKSLTSDLDRKKEEQQGSREQMQHQRKAAAQGGGDLGQSAGPAAVEGR